MNKQEKQEAIEQLKKLVKEGDTVYTILRHVSRSGMSRGIDLYAIIDNQPRWITGYAGKAMDRPQSEKDWREQRGIRINGCGMDMGFALVYDLASSLFGDGYKLKQQWL
jgi:hypothetical protein